MPGMLPMPPSTTMHRMITDSKKVKLSGDTKAILAAKNAPTTPAQAEPITKASILSRKVLMPMAAAATSSSRIAIQARPMREEMSRYMAATVNIAKARIR